MLRIGATVHGPRRSAAQCRRIERHQSHDRMCRRRCAWQPRARAPRWPHDTRTAIAWPRLLSVASDPNARGPQAACSLQTSRRLLRGCFHAGAFTRECRRVSDTRLYRADKLPAFHRHHHSVRRRSNTDSRGAFTRGCRTKALAWAGVPQMTRAVAENGTPSLDLASLEFVSHRPGLEGVYATASRGCNTHRIEVRRDKTSGLPLPLSASEVEVALVLGRSPGGVDLVKTLVVGTRRVHSADDGSRNGVPLQGLATTA
jgi:hypothetical protein